MESLGFLVWTEKNKKKITGRASAYAACNLYACPAVKKGNRGGGGGAGDWMAHGAFNGRLIGPSRRCEVMDRRYLLGHPSDMSSMWTSNIAVVLIRFSGPHRGLWEEGQHHIKLML